MRMSKLIVVLVLAASLVLSGCEELMEPAEKPTRRNPNPNPNPSPNPNPAWLRTVTYSWQRSTCSTMTG